MVLRMLTWLRFNGRYYRVYLYDFNVGKYFEFGGRKFRIINNVVYVLKQIKGKRLWIKCGRMDGETVVLFRGVSVEV